MLGDSFEFNGKTYTIKKDVSFGEYKAITRLQLEMKNATKDNEQELTVKFNDMMTDFLKTILGLSDNDIDSLGALGAAELFGKTFLENIQVKKKLETTSA